VKVGDWIVPNWFEIPPGEELWLAAEVLEDLDNLPWARGQFSVVRLQQPKFRFSTNDRNHKVWKTLEERVAEAMTADAISHKI